ncbi:hypothetical protein JW777_10900 [bacterium]|nr:hypothetical protein [bacterium]
MTRCVLLLLLIGLTVSAALHGRMWNPDLGNGMYKNPVLFADYSDPDVIRAGGGF